MTQQSNARKQDSPKKCHWPELILESTLYTLEQLQDSAPGKVHIALAGRSNVGKSSLINALARRRQLAKISSTPGKTRSVNLYRVHPDDFFLTDLPGYGYAQRSKKEREMWGELMERYLVESKDITAIALLLDCRISAQESDKAMARFALDHRIPLIAVLTKSDKCTQKERASRQREWSAFISGELALPVSSKTGLGLDELWKRLRRAAGSAFLTEDPAEQVNAPEDFGDSGNSGNPSDSAARATKNFAAAEANECAKAVPDAAAREN